MVRASSLTASIAAAGAALMLLGTFGPWATATPRGASTAVAVGGFAHGAWLVVVLAVVALGAAWFRSRAGLLTVAAVAIAWLAVVGYELPGVLLDSWAWGQAQLEWGFGAALLGAFVVLGAALATRSRVAQLATAP